MDDPLCMEVLQPREDTSDEEFGLVFSKLFALADVIAKVTSRHEFHDEKESFPILEGIEDIDEESE